MPNVIKKIDGYVYLVENAAQKGFETYYNMGKDIDDPRWFEDEEKLEIVEKEDDIIEIKPKKVKRKTKKEDTE